MKASQDGEVSRFSSSGIMPAISLLGMRSVSDGPTVNHDCYGHLPRISSSSSSLIFSPPCCENETLEDYQILGIQSQEL